MNLEDFTDQTETRRLLESLGRGGALGVPCDCQLASPKTLPVITELVRHGCILWRGRETVATDLYTLTPVGAALCRSAGIPCADGAEEGEPAASATAPPVIEVRADAEAVDALTLEIMGHVKRHMLIPPPSPQNVIEAVNALAVAAGLVIAGTGPNQQQVLGFFFHLVKQQAKLMQQPNAGGEALAEARPERLN